MAIYDANLGFGQLAAEVTTRDGVARAREFGVSAIGLRNVSHVGRVGDWAELAAEQGVISFHFVNSPAKPGVSPFGGIERRMATNPICIGYPVAGRDPLIVDMTTSSVAEGKLRVASAAGKGYGLSLAIDLLAGAFTGGKTVSPHETVNRNNMFSIFVDSSACGMQDQASEIASSYLSWVKNCVARDPSQPVLIPGEPEAQEKRRRLQLGIDVPDGVWRQVVATAEALGISEDKLA